MQSQKYIASKTKKLKLRIKGECTQHRVDEACQVALKKGRIIPKNARLKIDKQSICLSTHHAEPSRFSVSH